MLYFPARFSYLSTPVNKMKTQTMPAFKGAGNLKQESDEVKRVFPMYISAVKDLQSGKFDSVRNFLNRVGDSELFGIGKRDFEISSRLLAGADIKVLLNSALTQLLYVFKNRSGNLSKEKIADLERLLMKR